MSHSCDDTYDVYDEQRLTARKAHECDACDLPIRIGDGYWRIFIRFDGRAEHVKRCLRCQLLHEHLRTLDPGEMWPAERLDCGIEYEEHWDTEPPEWVANLAFWSPGDSLPARNPCAASLRYNRERANSNPVHRFLPNSDVCRRKPNGWGIEGPRENDSSHVGLCVTEQALKKEQGHCADCLTVKTLSLQ